MVNKKMKGFTLLELMVTVAILAILAGIAVSSYRRYIVKAHLQEAKSALSQDYLYLEKLYTKNNGYKKNKTNLITTDDLPKKLSCEESNSPSCYDITVNTNCGADNDTTTESKFCLKAIPRSAQAKSAGGGKECGTLTVDQTGEFKPIIGKDNFKCF